MKLKQRVLCGILNEANKMVRVKLARGWIGIRLGQEFIAFGSKTNVNKSQFLFNP